VFWFIETLLVERHMKWFHGPFPFWTFFWVRGSIYILMFVNVALGSGGVLLYTQRRARITWRKLAGIILFRFGLMLWAISVIMVPLTLAMHYYGLTEKARINMYVWWGFLIFGVVYLINGWMTWHHGTHFGISKYVVRDRNSEFWTAFRMASKRQWYLTWAMMLPPFILTIVGMYFLALAFNIHIPFIEFMVVGPLMLIVMDLPIAFGGFGTATMGWTLFFGAYGSEVEIAALTLFLPFARSACRALIGLVSLKPALEEVSSLLQEPAMDLEEESPAAAEDG